MPLTMKTFNRLAGVTALVCLCAFGAHAQQRPLLTEDVDIVPPGTVRLQIGIDFFQNAKFPLSDLTGDLTRVGVVGINVGLSPNVEFELDGVVQNFLSINRRGPRSAIPLAFAPGSTTTNDAGDFRLATKIKLRSETRRSPALGFKFGVELPNSNETRGIGVNQTNAFGLILVGKKFGRDQRLNLFGNLGLGIFTAPKNEFTQNDMLLYGLGGLFRINDHVNLAGEVNGRANTRSHGAPLGTEPLSQARLGLQIKTAGLRFDFAGIGGLTKTSPRSGVTFGVTYDSPAIFAPAK
jgi:hypothetical protein